MRLDSINLEAQTRAAMNQDTVSDYMEAMQAGATFPDLEVFFDAAEKKYYLADGFHRFHAADRLHIEALPVHITAGTRQDAIKFSFTANLQHGLRRTNADKRRAVEIAIREWPGLTCTQYAEMCGVGHDLASAILQFQLAETANSTRIGKDGKKYPAKRKRNQVQESCTLESDEPARIQTADEEMAGQDDPNSVSDGDTTISRPDSSALKRLKDAWMSAIKSERAEFLEWAKTH